MVNPPLLVLIELDGYHEMLIFIHVINRMMKKFMVCIYFLPFICFKNMSMIPTKSTESEDDSFLPFTADRHVTH
jgi:hypothetical protein